MEEEVFSAWEEDLDFLGGQCGSELMWDLFPTVGARGISLKFMKSSARICSCSFNFRNCW